MKPILNDIAILQLRLWWIREGRFGVVALCAIAAVILMLAVTS